MFSSALLLVLAVQLGTPPTETLAFSAKGSWDPPLDLLVEGDQLVALFDSKNHVESWRRQGGQWSFESFLPAPNSPNQSRAMSVAVDGDFMALGYPYHDFWYRGAVQVLRRSGGGWTAPTMVFPNFPEHNALFGGALAISGNLLFVGSKGALAQKGAVDVFEITPSGVSWIQRLTDPLGSSSQFGIGLAADGQRLMVSGKQNNLAVAWFFEQQGQAYAPVQRIVTPAGGSRLDCELEGDLAVLAAAQAGVFSRESGAWQHVQGISLPIDLLNFWYWWGFELASLEGDRLVLANPEFLDFETGNRGMAFVYRRTGGQFGLERQLQPAAMFTGSTGNFCLGMDLEGGALYGLLSFLIPYVPTDSGGALVYDFNGPLACTAVADVGGVSLSQGGTQQLTFDTCGQAPGQLWFLPGALTGGSGINVGSINLPLDVLDPYFQLRAAQLGSAPGASGMTTAAGVASGWVSVPPTSNPNLVGLRLQHAFAVLDLTAVFYWLDRTSNAVELLLLP